jgi:hypothetical protein
MAARNILHKSRVTEFTSWLESQGWKIRPGRGTWEIVQVQEPGANSWHVLFKRLNMPEHVTVPQPLVSMVQFFLDSTKEHGIEGE